MQNIKICFIGCGKHAKANIYPSIKLLNYKIAAVCAKHIESAEKTAKEFNIPKGYDDYKKMLNEEKPDAVFVVVPPELHIKIVRDCLDANCHVFVEKYLGENAQEAGYISNFAKSKRKEVMVGFMKRFAPAYIKLKEIINNRKEFGEIVSINGIFAVRNFTDDLEMFIKRGAIHYVDLIRHLGGEIKEIRKFTNNSSEVLAFKYQLKAIGTMFLAGIPSWDRHYEEIVVTGTKGYAKVENISRLFYHFTKPGKDAAPRWQLFDEEQTQVTSIDSSSSGGLQALYLNGFVGEVEHFLKAVEKGRKVESSAEENIYTMKLSDMVCKG